METTEDPGPSQQQQHPPPPPPPELIPIRPLKQLVIKKTVSACGAVSKRCPFCMYQCFGPDVVYLNHIVQRHVVFTRIGRSYDYQNVIPPTTLHSWCVTARRLSRVTDSQIYVCHLEVWHYCRLNWVCAFCKEMFGSVSACESHVTLIHFRFTTVEETARKFAYPEDSR